MSLKKRSASLLLSLAMLCTLLVPAASAANGAWSGSGTQDDPYLIEDAADLTALADNVNNGTSKYSGKYFKLTEDIEVTGWNPIGYSTSCYFSGDFDGDGHTITINGVDLTANSTQSSNYYGLFGYFNYSGSGSAMSYAKIHDLTVDGAYDVSSKTVTVYAGGIVGYSTGCVIANCVSTVNITASGTSNKGYAGGIAGYTTSVYTYLYNCYSSGTLSAWRTGGIVGHANSGKINYCFTETEPAFGADYGTKTGCYTAAEWAALSDAEKNAWVDAANASVSDYTSVDNFWSTDSDGNPVHVTCDHQHADDDLGVVTEPTCTDRGYTTYTCILCGNSYKDEYTDALGHDLSTETVDPTCTEPGSVTEICTRGDYTNTVELPALGHTPKEGTEVEYETYYEYTCDRCGETYTVFKDERLQVMTITGVNVTLSTDGTYEWEYDAAGNRLRSTNYDVNNTTSQTTITMSADSAFTVGFDYAVSSETNYDKLTITLDSTTVASAVSGTKSDSYASGELAAGTHTLVVKYVKDSSSKGGDDRGYLSNLVIAAVCPHINKSNVQHQDATCTENGYDSFHCDDCGADIYTEIEAQGHVWDEGVVTTEPSCTEEGEKTYTCVCTHEGCCGDVAVTKTEPVDALGHDYVDGYCSRCGAKEVAVETVTIGTGTSADRAYPPYSSYYNNALSEMIYSAEEVGTDGVITDLAFQVATTATSGSYATTSVKIYMGHTGKSAFDGATDWMAADGLTLVYSGAPALGAATGWETISLDTPFIYNGTDNLVVVVSRMSSTYNSYLTYYYTTSSDSTVLFRHNDSNAGYADYTNTATAGTLGTMRPNIQLTVEICEHENKSDVRHQDATCTVDGYDSFHCDDCGRDIVTVIPAQGHVWDEGVVTKEPTCEEDGVRTYTCTCDLGCCAEQAETMTETIPATGHTWVDVEVIQEPTCGEDGSKEQECSTCHETQIVSIPATGNHNFVDGVCTVCGALDQWDGETVAEPAADEDGVYLISSGAELAWFRDTVNGGQYSINAKLTRNINLGENAWTAIGGPYSTNAYAGTFDGGGFTVTLNSTECRGLFAYVGANGVVKNVVVDGSVSHSMYVGGVTSHNYGTVEYCVNKAAVASSGTSTLYVGGIVGYNYGDIRNCVNEGSITASTSGGAYAGGIFGYSSVSSSSAGNGGNVSIENCYNWGAVSAATTSAYSGVNVGGIGGYWGGNSGCTRTILNCYSTGAVSGAASTGQKVGGIVGGVMTGSSYTAKTTLANCWYLEGTAPAAYVPSAAAYPAAGDESTIGAKTEAELKSADFVANEITGYQFVDGGYPVLAWQEAGSGVVKGDVNGDGLINAIDAMLVRRAQDGFITLTGAQSAAADVNGDGSIDSVDAALILQYSVGTITVFE